MTMVPQSGGNNASVPPAVNAALSAFRGLLIAIGALMIGLHYDHHEAYKWIIEAAGATMIVGPMVWGIYLAGVTFYKSLREAVKAGINVAQLNGYNTPDVSTVEQTRKVISENK